MHVWIQKTTKEIDELQNRGKLPTGAIGYRYHDLQTGEDMVELHFHSCEEFIQEALEDVAPTPALIC